MMEAFFGPSAQAHLLFPRSATRFPKYVDSSLLPKPPAEALAQLCRNPLSCIPRQISAQCGGRTIHTASTFLPRHIHTSTLTIGRLVLNVVGPYRLYGEAVVRACAESGTDYLDICGEPEFMERMEARYGNMACVRRRRRGCI